jgi:hypothetical protein
LAQIEFAIRDLNPMTHVRNEPLSEPTGKEKDKHHDDDES